MGWVMCVSLDEVWGMLICFIFLGEIYYEIVFLWGEVFIFVVEGVLLILLGWNNVVLI